ncbi:MAG TPA: hypothetical protein PKC80_05970 [Burkholderiaceae bacterium]|nr:hypothetical protein [Burkholderiaceae bacterium]
MKSTVRKLLCLLAMAGIPFSVLAQNSTLDDFDQPMKSRTCGLILLSEGRAKIRNNDIERGMVDLVGAFALLQDGRKLNDKEVAREASQKLLNGSLETKTTSFAKCKQWLEERKSKPDFSNTEADRWNWVSQAQLTMQTEKK